jgi:ferredoxin
VSKQLRVNPILCEAHGVCAELLPELIGLDPWGYPILAPGPVPASLESLARRTVASCPALALLLEPSPPAAAHGPPPRRPLSRGSSRTEAWFP